MACDLAEAYSVVATRRSKGWTLDKSVREGLQGGVTIEDRVSELRGTKEVRLTLKAFNTSNRVFRVALIMSENLIPFLRNTQFV
jgi:hypothetical protein